MAEPHNSDSDAGVEWGTPKKYVLPLADAIDGFDLDPASGAEPTQYADTRYTEEDDGMAKEWYGNVWLNPPYGRKENPKWAKKTYREVPNTRSITALVPASTSENWWQMYYSEADIFCFIDGRIQFLGAGDIAASFGNVICVFNSQNLPGEYFEELSRLGVIMEKKSINNGSVFDY
jgi:phage N-6-adenine-methyltransferase